MKLRNILIIAFVFFAVVGTAYAGSVGDLTTFSSGTTAKASEVNDNFTAVKTAVDDNNARITTLEGEMDTAQYDITNIQGDVDLIDTELDNKLDKTGGTVTGTLVVSNVAYSTARTHYASISGDIFRPRVSSDEYVSGLGNGGAYISTASSTGTMMAQANLPDGAVITGVTFYVYDNDADNNLKAFVYLQRITSNGYLTLTSSVCSSGASSTVQALTATITAASSSTIVDNSSRAVVAFVLPDSSESDVWTTSLVIKGVTFAYTLNEAP